MMGFLVQALGGYGLIPSGAAPTPGVAAGWSQASHGHPSWLGGTANVARWKGRFLNCPCGNPPMVVAEPCLWIAQL